MRSNTISLIGPSGCVSRCSVRFDFFLKHQIIGAEFDELLSDSGGNADSVQF